MFLQRLLILGVFNPQKSFRLKTSCLLFGHPMRREIFILFYFIWASELHISQAFG
jgi:hypothetical protein